MGLSSAGFVRDEIGRAACHCKLSALFGAVYKGKIEKIAVFLPAKPWPKVFRSPPISKTPPNPKPKVEKLPLEESEVGFEYLNPGLGDGLDF